MRVPPEVRIGNFDTYSPAQRTIRGRLIWNTMAKIVLHTRQAKKLVGGDGAHVIEYSVLVLEREFWRRAMESAGVVFTSYDARRVGR